MAETTFTVKIAVQEDGSISLIDQAGEKIASLGQAASGAKTGLGSLEEGTRTAGTAAASAGGQMGEAGNKAGELGSKAQSATGGLSSMASNLLSLNAAVQLSKTAFEIGKAAFDAFFMNIVDRAGGLDDLSQKIGVAASTLSQFELAAQTTGTSLEGVGTGIKMLSKNLTEAAAGGSDSAKALKSAFEVLGVDVTASLTDTNGALLALADTFAAMPDGAQKTALAMELFGKAGADLIPFLNQGSEGIRKMTELNDALGLSLTEDTISALDNVGDKLQILGNVGSGVFTQLLAGAAPVLSQLADGLVNMAAQAGINSGTLQEWGQKIATTVVNAVATALGAIGQFLTDIANAGIGEAIYNAFASGLSIVGTLASAAMAQVKAAIYDALSVLPLAGGYFASLASNASAAASSMMSSLSTIGQGSAAIANTGQLLIGASDSLRGIASSASEAGASMSSAADGSDQMSAGVAEVSAGSSAASTALGLLKGAGDGAAAGTTAAAGGAKAAGDAAGGAAGGVDKLTQAMEKFADQSTAIATKQGIYDAYIGGAINYEQALIALDAAQLGGKEATESLTVAMQAEALAREQAAAALTQQTAEQMNKNAMSQAEVSALEAASAAGKGYEATQLSITAAVIQYQADQKLAAGMTGEQVAAWAEAQMQAANYKAKIEDLNQVLKNNDQIEKLTLELNLRKQVAAGVISQTQAERQMAVAAAGTNIKLQEQAGQIFDLNKSIEQAKDSFINIGDIIEGAFTQSFDAVISGTRDLGDALEGIGLSIGKQIFSAMLKSKFEDFDPTMKANFLDLGQFGESTFGKMFSSVIEGGKNLLGLGGGSGGAAGGSGEPIGQNADGSYIFSNPGAAKQAGSSFLADFMVGMGVGSFTKQATDSLRGGPSSTGSKGWDQVLQFQNMASTGLAQALGGPLAAAIVGVFNSFLPDIVRMIRDAFDTTTKGTKERVKGESELDRSPTFSKLQDKSNLGDFTRGDNKDLGLFDNYRTGVATAIERGMKEGEANAIKGAGEGIFSVIFKGDGDKMVNGAMDMGRGMAEFLSRGLADGMTYDEMLASLRSFAKENDITFKDALIGVNNFGKAAIEQFGAIGHADWGAQEFADGIYGISEIFKGDFPAGVNLASIALQTMEKDGTKAFSNLDASTKNWILSVSNDAESFKTVFASLAEQGFTIDTAEFEQTLADITASAQFVGSNITQLLSASTIGEGMKGIGQALKTEIQGALSENMLGDLFDTTGIATAFQELFANIRQLKSGEMSSGDFMSGMAEAIASGKANLDEYIPKIKAMREAMAEVEAAVDEAFKPTAAEELEARTLAMADGLKGAFGTGIGAALDAALAEGGDKAAGMQAFADSMKASIKDSVKQSIIQGMVEAATLKGPLAELMATFGQAFQGAIQGGISADEQVYLDALLGQISTVSDQTIKLLEPSVAAVLDLGAAADSTLGKLGGGKSSGVPEDPLAKQTKIEDKTISDSFASNVGTALSSVLSGGDVASAVASFSEGFKSSIGQSVMTGLQDALIQTATTEGALGGMMANFKEQTAAAMADGVLTAQEKANLSTLAGQIKDTASATATALEPIVGAVAEVGSNLVDSTAQASAQLAEMQGKVQSAFSGAVGAAFSAIGEGKSVAEAQQAFAESFKKSISQSVAEGLQEALVNSAVMEGALGGMMSKFKDMTAAAMSDGVITASEQADLAAMAAQIKTAGDTAAQALAPVVGAVAAITTGTSSAAGDVSFNVASQAQGYATQADTVIGTAATTASTTVATATTTASQTVATAVEQAGTAVASSATTAGAASQEALGTAAADFAEAAKGMSSTVSQVLDGASTSITSESLAKEQALKQAVEQASAATSEGTAASTAVYNEAIAASAATMSEALNAGGTTAGADYQAAVTAASQTIGEAVTQGSETSSSTVTTAYQEAAAAAQAALGTAGSVMSGDVTAASEQLKASVAALLGTGDAIEGMAPDAAYGIGQSLAAVRDKVAPEMQTQIDSLIGSLADASITPEESASISNMLGGLGTISPDLATQAATAINSLGDTLNPELAAQAAAALDSVGTIGESIDPEIAAKTAAALGSFGTIGESISPELAAQAAAALGSVGTIGEALPPELAAQVSAALGSVGALGDSIDPALMTAVGDTLSGIGTLGTSLPPELAAQAAMALESVGTLGESIDPATVTALGTALNGIGTIGTSLPPELAAQVAAALGSVGSLGQSIDPASMEATQAALMSLANVGTDVDPAGVEAFNQVAAALADGSSAMGDPSAVVTTMKALGDAALSSGDAANLAGTMQALGAAALDAGSASDLSATIQAFAASSAEGANNTTAVIDAFAGIDAGTSGQIQSSLQALVSAGVVAGADALSESLGGDGPSAITSGLEELQRQLDAGNLSSLTDPLSDALGSLTSPSDSVRSALDRMVNPTETATNRMQDLGYAVEKAVAAINGAAGSIRSGGTPAAASGGTFARGSAVVGEAGSPELVTANRGGGFSVHPLTWPEAKHLMRGGTPGMAVGGVVGGGTLGGDGGNTVPPAPVKTGGGYKANADGAEFADFTSAIVEAFRAGFEGSKSFIEDFSDAINESVRSRLVDAIMQGFSESPAIQQYAANIDTLITKAQELAGNNKLSAEELANIQTQIKQNTDAIGAQADQIDELLEPMRQAEAISTAISDGLDFSGALKSLALNPDDLEGFSKSIDETVNDAVLNGAIQGLLASGPIQDAVKKFGDSMNDAMATALEDGVISAEESNALHDLAVSGSAEMKTAMEALGPVLSALGIDLGDAMSEGITRAKETMKTASSAMDPFASLGEGETQFGNFTQSIRDQVYGNIKDGLIQAFIDSAVTNGLLAGPMMAIQSIFDQIGQKQMTTAQANAALAEQVAAINGSLNDPAFKSAFDTTMASISTIGQSLGQSSKQVVETAATSREVVQAATKDVCGGKCELEKRTAELGFASVNTFGRQASVSVEQMLPKLAGGGLVRERTTAIIGEAGPELVIPVRDLATPSNIQRLADIASAAAPSAGAPSTVQLDVDRMAKGADNTVDAIERLHDRLDKLSDAILAQPTEVNVQMDRETLMRAMAKADRFKKKARYGVTA